MKGANRYRRSFHVPKIFKTFNFPRAEQCYSIFLTIKSLGEQIAAATFDGEKEAYEQALKLEIDALGRINDEEMKSQRFENMDAIVEGEEGV